LRSAPPAIAYLKKRGLTGEIAARFGLGFAPDAWDGLRSVFADYQAPELVEAGLVIDKSDEEGGGRKRYDRFRDRVMFPIRNTKGQIIGFGGRIMEQGEPKYLNSLKRRYFRRATNSTVYLKRVRRFVMPVMCWSPKAIWMSLRWRKWVFRKPLRHWEQLVRQHTYKNCCGRQITLYSASMVIPPAAVLPGVHWMPACLMRMTINLLSFCFCLPSMILIALSVNLARTRLSSSA
jgi:hypothetical protein